MHLRTYYARFSASIIGSPMVRARSINFTVCGLFQGAVYSEGANYSRKYGIYRIARNFGLVQFRIFRMMPRRTKIKSTKSFTFEILINQRVLAKLVGVAFPRMRTYENKNTKIYSGRKFAPSKISRYTVHGAA